MLKNKSLIIGLFFLILGAFICGSCCSFAMTGEKTGVGMVISVEGRGLALDDGKNERRLFPMSMLDAGDKVSTDGKSSLTFVLFSTNSEYTLRRSSSVLLLKNQVKKISGSYSMKVAQVGIDMPQNTGLNSRKVLGQVVREYRLDPDEMESLIREERTDNQKPSDDLLPKREKVDYYGFSYPSYGSGVMGERVLFKWVKTEGLISQEFVIVGPDGKEFFSTKLLRNRYYYNSKRYRPLLPGKNIAKVRQTYRVMSDSPEKGQIKKRVLGVNFNVLSSTDVARVKKGEKFLKAALKKNRKDTDAMMRMMVLYLSYNLYPEAVKIGLRLEKLMPDNPNVCYYLAYAYDSMGVFKGFTYRQKGDILQAKLKKGELK